MGRPSFRRGVGELVGAAILAIIIFYALMLWYYSTIINLTNYVEGPLTNEIYYAEERLLVLPPRNGTIEVIGQWKGPSWITAVVCGYGTRNPRVIRLSNPIGIEPWRATAIDLPPSCKPTVCVFTVMGNLFCNISIPTKTITLKPAIIFPNESRLIAIPQGKVPLWLYVMYRYGVRADLAFPPQGSCRGSKPSWYEWRGYVDAPVLLVALDPSRTWLGINSSSLAANLTLRFRQDWWSITASAMINGSPARLCVASYGLRCGRSVELCESCFSWSGTLYIDGVALKIRVNFYGAGAMVVRLRLFAYGAIAVSSYNATGFGSVGIYLVNYSVSGWGGSITIDSPQVRSFSLKCSNGLCAFLNDRGLAVRLLPMLRINASIQQSTSSSSETIEILSLGPGGAPETWSKCALKQIGKGIYAGVCLAPILYLDIAGGYNPVLKAHALIPIAIAPQGFATINIEPVAIAAIIDKRSNKLTGIAINLGSAEIESSATKPETATITSTTFSISLSSSNAETAWIETLNSTPVWTLTNVTATQPPPPPQPAPSQNPPQPPIQPQVVIEETPMPNTTSPIPVTITVKIRYPGLPLIINQFQVQYEVYVHGQEWAGPVKSGYLELNLIPHSDEAVATLSVPGDRKYDVYITILFNGADIEDAVVRNYQLKLASG